MSSLSLFLRYETGKFLKHNVRWISQRFKIDKSFLILIETKYFRYIMNSLLTKVILVRVAGK